MQLSLETPLINYTPRYNNLTSIISEFTPNGLYDLMENFINIEFEYEPDNHDLWQEFDSIINWSRFKSIEINKITNALFHKTYQLNEACLHSFIREGYYIYLNAMPYYNSAYTEEFLLTFPHEILIYGYDEKNIPFGARTFLIKPPAKEKSVSQMNLFNLFSSSEKWSKVSQSIPMMLHS